MKAKISALIVLLFAVYFSANAQVLLTENFSYPAGDSIGAHGWTAFNGGLPAIMVVTPGLTYSGYPLSNIGNAAKIGNFGVDNYKALSSNETSGAVYTAFMVKLDSAKTGDYFLAYLPSTSTTNYACRVYAKDTMGTGIRFGISKSSVSGGLIVYSSAVYNYNTTYVLVAKYNFIASTTTDDEVSLFVFSSGFPSTEPAPTIGPVTGNATDLTDIGRVALRQGSSASSPIVNIDGIRTGKAWADLITTSVQNLSSVAESFSLSQNYPNPFNPETTIRFAIPSNGFVNMKVFNALGQEINTLVTSSLAAGTYSVKFNGANLMSGVYYCKIEFTSIEGKFFSDIKKLMLVK